MTVLLIVSDSSGERRCDAHCHDATDDDCTCVCAGRYHGKGIDAARELVRADAAAGRFGRDIAVTIDAYAVQGSLL